MPARAPYTPQMNNTAEARVIAAFTFIVALLLGAWVSLDSVALGSSLLPAALQPGRFILGLMPFVATAVAFQAGKVTQEAWARSLSGAAVMLGILASFAGLLYFIESF